MYNMVFVNVLNHGDGGFSKAGGIGVDVAISGWLSCLTGLAGIWNSCSIGSVLDRTWFSSCVRFRDIKRRSMPIIHSCRLANMFSLRFNVAMESLGVEYVEVPMAIKFNKKSLSYLGVQDNCL
uniref:Uncharacterized protein n=1 Tax=Schistocephalus solidus TaxID=70667 RepID=A0A0V0JCI9_SCHSO